LAYNGDGTFSFPYVWVNDAANGIPITASRMDTQFTNATQGFDNVICRDGQSTVTANIPLGGFKITGLAVATTTGDALSYGRAATVTTLNVFSQEIINSDGVSGSLGQNGLFIGGTSSSNANSSQIQLGDNRTTDSRQWAFANGIGTVGDLSLYQSTAANGNALGSGSELFRFTANNLFIRGTSGNVSGTAGYAGVMIAGDSSAQSTSAQIQLGDSAIGASRQWAISNGAGTVSALSFYAATAVNVNPFSAGIEAVRFTSSGSIQNVTGTYGTLSDERYKKWQDIPQPDYNAAIDAIWIGDHDRYSNRELTGTPERRFGVLAQQAYASLPDSIKAIGIIKPDDETGEWGASSEPFGLLSLKGVQDLRKRVANLEQIVMELQAKLG
jgi:hypothetical protein